MTRSARPLRPPACGAPRSGWPSTIELTGTLHHPTAEEVFQAVRAQIPKISLATVYKALEALVAIGVVDRLTAADGTGSARYDARSDDHYHFRCLRTGTVHDLPTRFDPD